MHARVLTGAVVVGLALAVSGCGSETVDEPGGPGAPQESAPTPGGGSGPLESQLTPSEELSHGPAMSPPSIPPGTPTE